ncbi:hypothetical protein V6N12_002600 [Hibiscus sabdariffa]|uniref:Uncharacterized protein n=1 Tax=Hibiscus sabdariffa TaxID=183260 RepID=A0ABR2E9G0_9ROSI
MHTSHLYPCRVGAAIAQTSLLLSTSSASGIGQVKDNDVVTQMEYVPLVDTKEHTFICAIVETLYLKGIDWAKGEHLLGQLFVPL